MESCSFEIDDAFHFIIITVILRPEDKMDVTFTENAG